jgi:hypothetical protein
MKYVITSYQTCPEHRVEWYPDAQLYEVFEVVRNYQHARGAVAPRRQSLRSVRGIAHFRRTFRQVAGNDPWDLAAGFHLPKQKVTRLSSRRALGRLRADQIWGARAIRP